VATLHTYISRLRGLLTGGARGGPVREVIAADADGYRLVLSAEEVDLGVFRARAAKARHLARAGAVEAGFQSFRDALAQWSGEPFLEFSRLRGLPWVDALGAERTGVTVECADLALRAGRGGEVVGLLRQGAAADPFHEPLHARLILALDAAGQRAAAVRAYAGVRRRLADELGVSPGAELASAFQQVLSG
jgi:DNA-binding SARP family transcriptional activator